MSLTTPKWKFMWFGIVPVPVHTVFKFVSGWNDVVFFAIASSDTKSHMYCSDGGFWIYHPQLSIQLVWTQWWRAWYTMESFGYA